MLTVVKSARPRHPVTIPDGSVTSCFLPFLSTTCLATIGSAYDLRVARISNGSLPAITLTPRSKYRYDPSSET
jgi:hypothetical protein